MVILGVTQENQVMNGDHSSYACLANAYRQFARKAMIHLHTVGLELANNAARPPVGFVGRKTGNGRKRIGIDEVQVRPLRNLAAQVVAPSIGCIQTQPHTISSSKIVGQRATVAAQSCTIAHDAFGIESYRHYSFFHE